MENVPRAEHEDAHEQYEREIKKLPDATGDAMPELRARRTLEYLGDLIGHIQQGLNRDGLRVSVSQLYRWFDVRRGTLDYPLTKSAPKLPEEPAI